MDDIITGDIGGRLRQAREQRGLSLNDVARVTKLSITVLRAIERNDFERLPEGVYRKGYLRSLAVAVGLDPEQIAAAYDREFEPVTQPEAAASRNAGLEQQWVRQLTPSSRRSTVTLVISIALAIGWFAWPDSVEPPLPAATLAGGPIAARALRNTAAFPTAIHEVSAFGGGTTIAPQTAAPLRIEMAATDWCWVAAESDGQRTLYRLVEPGERVALEGWEMISLRLGNAGSMMLSINDGPSRTAGGDGEVVELQLTPGNVESLRDGEVAVSGE